MVGFNFSPNSVRIACAKAAAGGMQITAIKTCNIEGLSDDAAAKVIKDTVKELKAQEPRFYQQYRRPVHYNKKYRNTFR